MEALNDRYELLFAEYDGRFDLQPVNQQMQQLLSENKQLHEEIKRLNHYATCLIEFKKKRNCVLAPDPDFPIESQSKSHSMAVSRHEFSEERLQTIQKLLNTVQIEHQTLSARLAKVAEPQYAADMQTRIQELDVRTAELSRKQKSLALQQQHRGKELSKALDGGDADILQQINAMKAELNVLEHKATELGNKEASTTDSLSSKGNKLTAAKVTWKKLLDDAVTFQLDVSVIDPSQAKESPTLQKHSLLSAKKESLEKQLTLLATRLKVTQHEYTKKLETTQEQVSQLRTRLQQRTQYFITF